MMQALHGCYCRMMPLCGGLNVADPATDFGRNPIEGPLACARGGDANATWVGDRSDKIGTAYLPAR